MSKNGRNGHSLTLAQKLWLQRRELDDGAKPPDEDFAKQYPLTFELLTTTKLDKSYACDAGRLTFSCKGGLWVANLYYPLTSGSLTVSARTFAECLPGIEAALATGAASWRYYDDKKATVRKVRKQELKDLDFLS